ncbi:cupin domain-containing protein [candidate division WOR-3 bacterium]|nr:cupin domain-containing protein [candidate division WOR-3 bacterium]
MEKINLKEYSKTIKELWQPYEIAFVNDTALRIAKIKGAYRWHKHKNEDEFFFVVKGSAFIDFKNETIELNEGEGCLVKKGIEHRSRSKDEATILLIEPISTKTKGE